MFTTPCFIWKNTPALVDKLKNLGYITNIGQHFSQEKYLIAYKGVYLSEDDINDLYRENCVDCLNNEELFLAIAALRMYSDENQWFTDGKTWFKCQYESIEQQKEEAKNNNYFGAWIYNCHKATVKELVEHFKSNKMEISENKKSEQEILASNIGEKIYNFKHSQEKYTPKASKLDKDNNLILNQVEQEVLTEEHRFLSTLLEIIKSSIKYNLDIKQIIKLLMDNKFSLGTYESNIHTVFLNQLLKDLEDEKEK